MSVSGDAGERTRMVWRRGEKEGEGGRMGFRTLRGGKRRGGTRGSNRERTYERDPPLTMPIPPRLFGEAPGARAEEGERYGWHKRGSAASTAEAVRAAGTTQVAHMHRPPEQAGRMSVPQPLPLPTPIHQKHPGCVSCPDYHVWRERRSRAASRRPRRRLAGSTLGTALPFRPYLLLSALLRPRRIQGQRGLESRSLYSPLRTPHSDYK